MTTNPSNKEQATPVRPVWWTKTHTKALAALEDGQWHKLTDLLAQGFGSLVFCELNVSGYADRRLVDVNYATCVVTDHLEYRKASGL